MHSSSAPSFSSSSSSTSTSNSPLPRRTKRGRGSVVGEHPILKGIDVDVLPFLVIGGGVAGVSCARELARLNPDVRVVLLTSCPLMKETHTIMKVTEVLEDLTVYEKRADRFQTENPNIIVLEKTVASVDTEKMTVTCTEGSMLIYTSLCICSGASPRTLIHHPRFLSLRDTQSAAELADHLTSARCVVVLGNGGIALEVVSLLDFCDVIWIIKDHSYVGNTFFDATASAFMMPQLSSRFPCPQPQEVSNSSGACALKKHRYDKVAPGSALGPEWATKTALLSNLPTEVLARQGSLKMHFGQRYLDVQCPDSTICSRIVLENDEQSQKASLDWSSVEAIEASRESHVMIRIADGTIIHCDFVISAIGVEPNVAFLGSELTRGRRGAILVNEELETSVPGIWAAGDCCWVRQDVSCPLVRDKHWLQMQLWSQGKNMGLLAAQSMSRRFTSINPLPDAINSSVFFDIFAHTTHFFGHKVVLLGRFNAQGLLSINDEAVVKEIVIAPDAEKSMGSYDQKGASCDKTLSPLEIWTRVVPGKEYVKFTVYQGRLVGALLIGDTNLEEVAENLIMNALDISNVGEKILDPDIDIDDYFD